MQNNIGEARRSYALAVGGFSQKDAAACFGVSVSAYKKWEQGIGMLNGVQLCAIADKYGVTTDYLLRRSKAPDAVRAPSLPVDPSRAELLRRYGRLNGRGREILLEQAAAMDESGRYGKKGGELELRAAL